MRFFQCFIAFILFKIEIASDCPSSRTTGGYFCSLLISNIFLNPLFLRLPFALFNLFSKLHISLFCPLPDGIMFCVKLTAKGEFPALLIEGFPGRFTCHLYKAYHTAVSLILFSKFLLYCLFFTTNNLPTYLH